jgi:DNA-binding MarR family transcriptional regulator
MAIVGANGPRGKEAIAADVWRMLAEFSFAMLQRGRHFDGLKELGLTPGHFKVLAALEPGTARPMGVIADACNCDPSMATWLVDRLEERGLVSRATLLTDRRVKTVVLTTRGVTTKERLFARLFEPPDELLTLDKATLESLRRELKKLPGPPATSMGIPTAHEDPRPARRRT